MPRTFWVQPMVKKSVQNNIEWCSQSTKRLNFGQRYEDIIVIAYYIIMIGWSYMQHTLLYCMVLYYTTLYYIILCSCWLYICIILYYTVIHVFHGVNLCCTLLYILRYIILYYITLYYTIPCCSILACTVLYYTILWYTVLYNIVLYYTVLYFSIV